MTQAHLIADELGDLRTLIRTLKAREAELRRRVIDRRPNDVTAGTKWTLEVRHGTRKSLNRKALPQNILDDPRYWTETATETLICRSVDEAPAAKRRPAQPGRSRDLPAAAYPTPVARPAIAGCNETEADFEVIDR
ncbi:MAG: hypothetical protein AAF761_02670 [Pseudomonadota bacterium]